MAKLGKRSKAANAAFEGKSNLTVEDAVKLIKGAASAKFDETLEIAMNLGVDPRHADQMVRGAVNLPHGTGKSVRIVVFAKGDKAKEALEAGANFVGAEDLGTASRLNDHDSPSEGHSMTGQNRSARETGEGGLLSISGRTFSHCRSRTTVIASNDNKLRASLMIR